MQLFNWKDEELRDFTHLLGSLFLVTKTTDSETIKPYHKSLADWLGDEAKAGMYFVSEMEGHRMLADYGWQRYCESSHSMSRYALKNTPCHLYEAKRYLDLYKVLHDSVYVAAAKIFDIFDPLDYLPEHVRSWAYGCHGSVRGAGTARTGVLLEPGHWFAILEQWWTHIDWSCNKCSAGNGQAPELRPNSQKCPKCGWEGRVDDRSEWLKAKAEFERKRQEGEVTS